MPQTSLMDDRLLSWGWCGPLFSTSRWTLKITPVYVFEVMHWSLMWVLRVCPPKRLQIEELTSNLTALQALSSSASSVDSMAGSETGSPPMKRKVVTKFQGNAKKAMLRWVQTTATKYDIFTQIKHHFFSYCQCVFNGMLDHLIC